MVRGGSKVKLHSSRQIAGQPATSTFGQNQKQLNR
jgi:hypothetical protein